MSMWVSSGFLRFPTSSKNMLVDRLGNVNEIAPKLGLSSRVYSSLKLSVRFWGRLRMHCHSDQDTSSCLYWIRCSCTIKHLVCDYRIRVSHFSLARPESHCRSPWSVSSLVINQLKHLTGIANIAPTCCLVSMWCRLNTRDSDVF